MTSDAPGGLEVWSERIEGLAWVDNVRALVDVPANALAARWARSAPCPLPLLAKVPLAMLKRVVGLGLERPATLGEIDGMVRFYATAGVADYAGGLAASSRHG